MVFIVILYVVFVWPVCLSYVRHSFDLSLSQGFGFWLFPSTGFGGCPFTGALTYVYFKIVWLRLSQGLAGIWFVPIHKGFGFCLSQGMYSVSLISILCSFYLEGFLRS